MSDQSPPPAKPKPGSLRDRIAAFEKSATSAAPAPAPAPRPKPAGFQSWKPKAPSPPVSPSAGATEHASPSAVKPGGMSASDAKESITKAGSLKDRMAALQGKGAFGAPPPLAPKPAVEKPKWKPPPVVQAPVDDDDHTGEASTTDIATAVERTISPPVSVKSPESFDSEGSAPALAPAAEGDNEDGAAAADPEEEERQRRAAIAARMARLGGARVGMAPPVFGKKPPVRKATQDSEEPKHVEEPEREISSPEVAKSPEPASDEALPASSPDAALSHSDITKSPESAPVRKNSESVSLLSSESTESHSSRSPASMPVPSAPRRAGPPRKKPAKAVPPPPTTDLPVDEVHPETAPPESAEKLEEKSLPEHIPQVEVDNSETQISRETPQSPLESSAEVHVVHDNVQPEPVVEKELVSESAPEPEEHTLVSSPPPISSSKSPVSESSIPEEPSGAIAPPPSLAVAHEEQKFTEDNDDDGSEYSLEAKEPEVAAPAASTHHVEHAETVAATELEDSSAVAPVEEDELSKEAEEEARKKRVAERIAKMGGINPFAPPPLREAKSSSESSQSPPPLPEAVPAVPPPPPPAPPAVVSEEQQPVQKEAVVRSNVEPELSDEENEGEGSFLDDEPSEHEGSKAPVSPSVVAHHEQLNPSASRSSASVPSSESHPLAHVKHQSEEYVDEEGEASDEEFIDEVPVTYNQPISHSTELPKSSAPQHPIEASPPARPAQPPRRIIPQAPESNTDEDEEQEEDNEVDDEVDERLAQSHLFVPPPGSHRNLDAASSARHDIQDEEDGDGSEDDTPALPYIQRRSMEVLPPRRVPTPPSEYDSDQDSDHDGQALPVPPRSSGPPPRVVPPLPLLHQVEEPVHHPPHIGRALPSAPSASAPPSAPIVTPSLSISGSEEVLDEEEGDPIDPAFHSPSRHASANNLFSLAQAHSELATSPISSPPPPPPPVSASSPPPPPRPAASSPPLRSPVSSSPPSRPAIPSGVHSLPQSAPIALDALEDASEEQEQEDPEQSRRKTIAERMAKLGGIRFGGAPPSVPITRPPPPPSQEEEGQDTSEHASEDIPTEISEEEDERARKERIAAKLATMGGMRIGMMPMGMGSLAPRKSHVLREEDVSRALPQAPVPSRAVPPARPPPSTTQPHQVPQAADTDSEYESALASEDGVKVEAEESELEEVTYEDASEEVEEEAPPPVPSRIARAPSKSRSSSDNITSPTTPSFRPPVPTAMPVRRSSVQTTRSASVSSATEPSSYSSPTRQRPSFVPAQASEYVMVEEPESQEVPPPPPARPTSRLPPARNAPPAPQPPLLGDPKDSISSQWELPSIPTSQIDFGEGADLSLSWTDAGEATSPTTSSHVPPPPPKQTATLSSSSAVHLSADDLMTLWGRVGVQVCEVATSMFEKSKKSLIGDGTYSGFVQTVLAAVPSAVSAPSGAGDYGYLVYSQNGPTVQKRVSDIMPGDIVEIQDGKFKGHKGLQTYHQNVGAAPQPLVGVVGEFEAKKTKIRVFHANQHVGQQSIESVSYRLEDLKSGIVKVYRVLET